MGRREVRNSETRLRRANPDVSGGPGGGLGQELSLFKHSDFLKFWSADSISFFGSQFSAFAIPWVAVGVFVAGCLLAVAYHRWSRSRYDAVGKFLHEEA